jgi:hypothetical protein
MTKDPLRYDQLVDSAIRGVVREVLKVVADRGLPGSHHFYITFRTSAPGVMVPDYLRAQYPTEMTIVLQFQFYGLEVTDQGFSVTLSFNSQHERLVVPFAAITTFADPSVSFALQFQPTSDEAEAAEEEEAPAGEPADVAALPLGTAKAKEAGDGEGKTGQVVALDAFRKK